MLKENVEFYYKIYNEAYKNKWCPAPILKEIKKEEKTIKEDKTIPENTLLIMIHEIKGLDEKKKNIIDLFCQYESENNLKDDIKEKHDDVLYEKQISFNEKKFLMKNSLILTLKEISESKLCNCFWNNKKEEKVIGYLEIDFKDFKSKNIIEDEFEFQDMTKKKKIGISIKVSLKIRKA